MERKLWKDVLQIVFSLSLFAHGPGGFEYLRIRGDDVLGLLLLFMGFQIVILPFETRDVFLKDSFRISWSFDLSLLLVRLYFILLSGV